VEQNTFTLRGHYGSRLSEDDAEYVTWYQREIGRREVAVSLPLPIPVNADEATATFQDGILRLTLPKLAEMRARRIPIKTSEPPQEG
jgi:HSP20 family protein